MSTLTALRYTEKSTLPVVLVIADGEKRLDEVTAKCTRTGSWEVHMGDKDSGHC